ncbi:phage major tail protein, TP901-1 family [Novosphingobium sediminicola]|uniref:TP901-1 family phage major tail protein n=1 Tax=Novosphingobium sediminicola TaxID=563162 RepID=A0A7W6CH45_9SPHN|nr:phage major tail protein, TP901-1 family [Novosphingobium sediminicola]MBB3956399.1 TP901-1 family phage major tail protein [Novosphingobium sediminicola]
MTAQSGAAFLLKITDGAATPTFNTVAGLRTTQMSIAGQAVTITTKDSAGWRDLLSGAGARTISVSAAGVFMGSAAETRIRDNALGGVIDTYQLSFEDGSKMQGRFLVQKLEYSGDYNSERSYTIQLESSGPVVSV